MINKYKQELLVNGFSKQTISDYISRVKRFLKQITIENINNETVKQYFLTLKEEMKTSSINKHRDTLKHFFAFLGREEVVVPNSLDVDRKIPAYISEEFFEKEIIPIAEMIFKKREKTLAILYFLFYTGLRRNEIVMLRRKDIDLEKETFKVYMSKSKREKYGFFTSKVKQILQTYFRTEEETSNAFNISGAIVANMFKKLSPYFKDIKPFNPRLFRHSFGTLCRQRGIKLEDIKDLMGHKSISTTMIYAHSNPEELRKKYKDKIEREKDEN